jgi:hypothetical protein
MLVGGRFNKFDVAADGEDMKISPKIWSRKKELLGTPASAGVVVGGGGGGGSAAAAAAAAARSEWGCCCGRKCRDRTRMVVVVLVWRRRNKCWHAQQEQQPTGWSSRHLFFIQLPISKLWRKKHARTRKHNAPPTHPHTLGRKEEQGRKDPNTSSKQVTRRPYPSIGPSAASSSSSAGISSLTSKKERKKDPPTTHNLSLRVVVSPPSSPLANFYGKLLPPTGLPSSQNSPTHNDPPKMSPLPPSLSLSLCLSRHSLVPNSSTNLDRNHIDISYISAAELLVVWFFVCWFYFFLGEWVLFFFLQVSIYGLLRRPERHRFER